jgi:hypothetical protein
MGTVLGVILALGQLSCVSGPIPLGQQGSVRGDYSFGALTVQFDRDLTVLAVLGAAESALIRRGYTVTNRFGAEDRGRVVGRYPSAAGSEMAEVWVQGDLQGPTMQVKVGAMGELGASRDLANDILALLGR